MAGISNQIIDIGMDKVKSLLGIKEESGIKIDRASLMQKIQLNELPELSALNDIWGDPLYLNFRLMINYDKPYGLFAGVSKDGNVDKNVINSAVNYLFRIGETTRANMLVSWIRVFMDIIRNYEYLFITVEGLSDIFNHKQGDIFTDQEKILFTIRETIDMKFQSLLTTYRQIWFDDARGVEVLPANLRRFDCLILVYSAGYFKHELYNDEVHFTDALGRADTKANDDIDAYVLPTMNKLFRAWVYNASNIDRNKFNSTLFYIADAQIDLENSGKTFFETVNNTMEAEITKNTLSLNFRFAWVSGVYNNIFGKLNFANVLAMADAADKANNPSLKDILKQYSKDFKDAAKDAGKQFVAELKQRPLSYLDAMVGKNSVIGNALNIVTDPEYLPQMVKYVANRAIGELEHKFIYGNISKVNNLLANNFSDAFLDIYGNSIFKDKPKTNITQFPDDPNQSQFENTNNNIELMENPPESEFAKQPHYLPDKPLENYQGITYQERISEAGYITPITKNITYNNRLNRETF